MESATGKIAGIKVVMEIKSWRGFARCCLCFFIICILLACIARYLALSSLNYIQSRND